MLASVHYINQPKFDRPYFYGKGFLAKELDFKLLGSVITNRVWSGCTWRGGIRSERNFISSDYMVLDFDNGYALEQAINDFCDCAHIIGTTKSHGQQKNGVICDRFRLVIPWNRRITDLRTYRYNMARLVRRYEADRACIDGARFFWPCLEIVSAEYDLEGGFLIEVHEPPEDFEPKLDPDDYVRLIQHKRNVVEATGLQGWLKDFLERGITVKGSRNLSCYAAAIELYELGYSREDIVKKLVNAPFPRDDFHDREIMASISSAEKRIAERLTKN